MRNVIWMVAVGLLVPRLGRACWDSESAIIGPVCISYAQGESGDFTWEPGDARELAAWGSRMAALLPEGATLNVHFGSYSDCSDGGMAPENPFEDASGLVEYCAAGTSECALAPVAEADLSLAFDAAAGLVHANEPLRRSARMRRAAAWTVQLLATRNEARANALLARIADDDALEGAFYSIAGHPGREVGTGVIATHEGGRTLYRVLAGAFLDRASAEALSRRLAPALPVEPFVRTVPPDW